MFFRQFLSSVPAHYPKSTLHERLKFDNALDSFTNLDDKWINWHSGRKGIGSEIDSDHQESSDDEDWVPFAKRRK